MRHSRSKSWARVLYLLLALILVGVAIAVGATVLPMQRHMASAQASLAQLEGALAGGQAEMVRLLRDPNQLAALQDALTTLDADVAALEALASPFFPLCPHLGWLPQIGGNVAAVPDLLSLAHESTTAARRLTDALTPLAAVVAKAQSSFSQLGPQVVRALAGARTEIEEANAAAQRAGQVRSAIDADQLSPGVKALLARLDRYQPSLQEGTQALTVLPELLGANGARTYLILTQNSQELRATGGFISGVGIARVKEGQIEELVFRDSYAVDDLSQPHPLPPEPLRQQMGAEMLVLRDGNWWPDFPTSARVIAELYRQDQGEAVDGVIAVDLTTLQLLVQALGPIQVPGYDEPVTSDNLLSTLMTYWQAPRLTAPGKEGSDWWLHRKDLAGDLMRALLLQALEQTTPDGWPALAQAVIAALHQRHLLIYVNDPKGQTELRKLAWDGSLRPADGDYLMVVDSNVGFNKVNPNIEQTIDYQVMLDAGGKATVQLTLSYRHRVQNPAPACVHETRYGDEYADLMERCYWDYVRIYVPAGSELIDLRGGDTAAVVFAETGKAVIATSFLLETAQARRIQVTYSLDQPIDEERYVLLVQKQPGTEPLPLRITCVLPDGHVPTNGTPEPWVWTAGKAVWQGTLDQDREFVLSWE